MSVFHNVTAEKFIACYQKVILLSFSKVEFKTQNILSFIIMLLIGQHMVKIYTAYQYERTGLRLQAFIVITSTCMGALCAYNLNHL